MANHRMLHFGGELVHPNQSFITGENPSGDRVYMTFTTDWRSITTLEQASSAVEHKDTVAELHWNGDAFGAWISTTRGGRELRMSELADITRRPPGMRAFMSKSDDDNGCNFMWVRLPGNNGATHSYNLLDERSGHEVGRYRYHGPIASPQGVVTYATFEYAFISEVLFFDAMMSLYINRFLDSRGRAI